MATSSSLVVKISADINDFSKQLNQMTRGVDQAAAKIEKFGKAITVGITLPVTAAAVALAKMAAENEDTGARLERVFGSAAASVNASIQQMMKSVPEANTDLQKMAITAQNMALGLGLAPAKASQVSESLLKLAGDASAFAHVPMAEALDALSRGLAGKTKGLLEFGIAISEADIKARAMQMGLLHTGNELTETGTALAAYSLIMEKSSRIQGEAARTADQSGKSFAFLKRDLSELADNVSGIVLPALSDLAKKARDVVGWFASLDQSTVKTFFGIAAAAAVIGPTIVALVKLADAVVKVRAAFVLLAEGGTIGGFIGALAALPVASIVAGILAIAAAVGTLYLAYEKFKDSGSQTRTAIAKVVETVSSAVVSAPFGQAVGAAIRGNGGVTPKASPLVIEHQAKALSQSDITSLLTSNAPTERAPAIDPLKAMEDTAKRLTDAFKHMADGWEIPNLTSQWVTLLGQAQAQYDGIKDKTSEIATRVRDIIASLRDTAGSALLREGEIANLSRIAPASSLPVTSTKQFGTQVLAIDGPKIANVGQAFSTSGLMAAAALEHEAYQLQQIDYQYAGLRNTLEQFGITLGNVSTRAALAINIAAGAALQFAQQLVAGLGGHGPAANTGRGIGQLVGTIGGAFIPVLGPLVGSVVGGLVGSAAGGLIGGLFDHPKKASDSAANSLDALARTVDKATESITNIPAFFKVQYYRFTAAPVVALPSGPPPKSYPPGSPVPNPNGPDTPTQGDPNNPSAGGVPNGSIVFTGDLHFPNVTDGQSFVDTMTTLRQNALKARGRGGSARFALAGGNSF